MLRKVVTIFLLVFTSSIAVFAQNSSEVAQSINEPPKQSARQALIEMFLGKGPEDFLKHLPDATRRALIHKGDTMEGSWALRLAEVGRAISMQGQKVETFDEGPAILVMNDPRGHDKVEVMVEHDSFMGESDEIELSIRYSKDGQPAAMPFVPRFIFTLQEEKETWRLAEVTAAAHIPLTDPDYLKGLRKLQDESNEATIQMRVMTIARAEKAYAQSHPDHGYACNLATIFGQQQTELTPQPPSVETPLASMSAPDVQIYDPGQQNEVWNGYRFTLSGCDGPPASKYALTVAPADPEPDVEMKTFCTDESEVIKFVAAGKPASCASNGQPLNPGAPPAPSE